MKKFISKIALFSIFCASLIVGISISIDPYNVFHLNNVRDNGIEPNKNFIKMNYILSNPQKYDSLLFGSSRVGSIHTDKIDNEHCYNMTYSEGIPAEHLDNIKTLIKNNVPIKKIYMGLDTLSYNIDPLAHQKEPMRASYEYLRSHPLDFLSFYLDSSTALSSLETSKAHVPQENLNELLYSYGWWCEYNAVQKLNPDTAYSIIGPSYCLDETLATIAEIVTICENANIELIVFTNPMYYVTYDDSLNYNYLEFIERLASITNFYNFSGINDITLNADNYTDSSHYNAEVGDLMIDCMCHQKCDDSLYSQGFGVYVTSENVDYILSLLAKSSELTN